MRPRCRRGPVRCVYLDCMRAHAARFRVLRVAEVAQVAQAGDDGGKAWRGCKHIVAYVRRQGTYYRADDADVRCMAAAHVCLYGADMRIYAALFASSAR